MSDSLWPPGLQHTRRPYPSLSHGACSNSCPLSQWCHPTISSSLTPLFLLLSVFPSIRVFFPVSQLFASGGQIIGVSALASVLPVNIQGWFPLGLTGLISFKSKGLSRVFSSTTVPSASVSSLILTNLMVASLCSHSENSGADINLIVNGYCRSRWVFLFSQIYNDKEHILKEIN